MNKRLTFILIIIGIFVAGMGIFLVREGEHFFKNNELTNNQQGLEAKNINLPSPSYKGMDLEQTLKNRRSIRNYKDKPLTKKELSQLLWAAQGVTDQQRGFRTAPSAGALYPLEIYIDAKKVEGFPAGVYKYKPENHQLILKNKQSQRDKIYQAALRQNQVKQAPVLLIITGVYQRVTKKYGKRGVRYTHLEAGHVAQNIYLQATSLGLGTVSVGAFEDNRIKEILDIEAEPFYLMPVGKPAS